MPPTQPSSLDVPDFVRNAARPGECTVYGFFERDTSTWQFIVADDESGEAFIIDSVLDFEPASGAIGTKTADGLLKFINKKDLNVKAILETHVHADHLTAAQYLKRHLGPHVPVGIGSRVTQAQATFQPIYAFEDFRTDGSQFDLLFADGEELALGGLKAKVLHLPGHTPEHVGYLVGEALFTGDTIFTPDIGSARTDFPGGSAPALYSTLSRLLSFPPHYQLYLGHDYPPPDRSDAVACTPVAEQRERNKHFREGVTEEEFVRVRTERDKALGTPRLLHASLQVNLRAGNVPGEDGVGRRFFKVPVKLPASF